MCLKSPTGHYYSLLTIIHFQKCEIQLVYLDELYAAVNNHIERFLNSCTFYFIRSTKGKMNMFLHIFRHLIEELPQRLLFVSCIETIDNPPDLKEANNSMPKLFDFGMQCGHPLLVQQYKLSHVSKSLVNYYLSICEHLLCISRVRIDIRT